MGHYHGIKTTEKKSNNPNKKITKTESKPSSVLRSLQTRLECVA